MLAIGLDFSEQDKQRLSEEARETAQEGLVPESERLWNEAHEVSKQRAAVKAVK